MLDLINEARTALKLKPLTRLPKGRLGDPCECVIARSLGVRTGRKSIRTLPGEEWKAKIIAQAWGTPCSEYAPIVVLPELLEEFVKSFDAGLIPELIDA